MGAAMRGSSERIRGPSAAAGMLGGGVVITTVISSSTTTILVGAITFGIIATIKPPDAIDNTFGLIGKETKESSRHIEAFVRTSRTLVHDSCSSCFSTILDGNGLVTMWARISASELRSVEGYNELVWIIEMATGSHSDVVKSESSIASFCKVSLGPFGYGMVTVGEMEMVRKCRGNERKSKEDFGQHYKGTTTGQ